MHMNVLLCCFENMSLDEHILNKYSNVDYMD